jgi:hypothetical protein
MTTYEVTYQHLSLIMALGMMAGIFGTVYITRVIEVVHTWKMVQATVVSLLIMCITIVEDIAFIKELKTKTMKEAGFTDSQVREFNAVYDQTLKSWKESVIAGLKNNSPKKFHSMLPFSNWNEATRFILKLNRAERGKNDEGTWMGDGSD